jgi:hypothetical protein
MAIEQNTADLAFQPLDRYRKRWLRYPAYCRCLGEIAQFANHEKILHCIDVHVGDPPMSQRRCQHVLALLNTATPRIADMRKP